MKIPVSGQNRADSVHGLFPVFVQEVRWGSKVGAMSKGCFWNIYGKSIWCHRKQNRRFRKQNWQNRIFIGYIVIRLTSAFANPPVVLWLIIIILTRAKYFFKTCLPKHIWLDWHSLVISQDQWLSKRFIGVGFFHLKTTWGGGWSESLVYTFNL